MSAVNNMAESSSLYSDYRFSSDMGASSDDDDFVSSASTTSTASEERSTEKRPQWESVTASNNGSDNQPSTCSVAGPSDDNTPDPTSLAIKTEKLSFAAREEPVETKRPLLLLDLPMDILQDVVKEVTHTNDLTSLALTCSTLHALAIPQMYSRFDIVWPDTLSSSDHPAGVDALSYGLATLVMGDDIFHELPPTHRPAGSCAHCGCNTPHDQTPTQQETGPIQRIRRGNYYAQYTRKFSVGNGPLIWVQEYSVTKETGKMLGTLVALAIARMINLETFVWDMPTGVLRDVWIALSSLANRPGHECRLERVWVRWHDNSESPIRSAPTASSFALPDTQNDPAAHSSGPPLLHKYGHVEYPSLSIVPPLKSLSVLDIDESSYIEEAAVLIRRSWDRLKELRVGISSKVCQADWLKPLGGWSSRDTAQTAMTGWPKVGGVLGMLLSKTDGHPCVHGATGERFKKVPEKATDAGVSDSTNPQLESPPPTGSSDSLEESSAGPVSRAKEPSKPPNPSFKSSPGSLSSDIEFNHDPLRLETLELERVALSIPVMLQSLDWIRITALTILRCDGHEKLWRSLRRQFPPSCTLRSSPRAGKRDGQSEYSLRIKHIHTDAVSPYLLLFIKDTLAPNTLETLFLHEAPMYDSIVHIDAIYRNVIRNHRMSLKKILIDSTERSAIGVEIATSRWRKWMFTRDMISFVTSGRMPRLRELSMTLHSKDWHYFLQRLPNVPHLRALHIPHIAHPVHRDSKELALQILDIVTIRPDVGISYVGMQNKCYEILEGKRGDKVEFDDADDSHSEGLGDGEPWSASDTEDDEGDDEAGATSTADSTSLLSSDHASSDGDESDLESSRSRVTFRLREILFYDDKIAIFKARHGVL
ncbi:hypothetical protein P170DRAFT_461484 [Aspergillus steynii IBT 23096]|uniref:F-box domain-containing protein n=1 Tax=Aspergillus steynii IBT 23096 TaxID=1392250 RepID=A0A2I2GS11_9EURO|nr:uncharacterized protein P170DRAFT_461484 [Aspergillus steynii IBT 23096]PLB55664.1 hypothetical protein P170DRAFT_461484 [Aspergillus steynii IBT 23096]